MRSIIFSMLIVLFSIPTFADDGLYNGLVQQGYTFNDGFWWRDNVAYLRSTKTFSFFDGHQQCLTTRYVFERAPEALVGEPIEGWRKELLELKAKRDKWEADIKASQEEQKEFLETVEALGLGDYYGTDTSYPSPLTGGGYGQAQQGYDMSQYNLQGSSMTYSAPLAAQGNTLYGYDQFAQSYPDVDLQILYNQANNLAKQAQMLSSDATADFSALVFQEGKRQEELAKILARGKVAAQVLQLLQDPTAELKVDQWRLQRRGEGGNWEVVPGQKEKPKPAEPKDTTKLDDMSRMKLFGIIQNRCIACHGPEKKNAGLDMTKFLAFDADKKKAIVQTLIEEDPDLRMPKAAGGVPGKALPMDEIDLFFEAAGLARKE